MQQYVEVMTCHAGGMPLNQGSRGISQGSQDTLHLQEAVQPSRSCSSSAGLVVLDMPSTSGRRTTVNRVNREALQLHAAAATPQNCPALARGRPATATTFADHNVRAAAKFPLGSCVTRTIAAVHGLVPQHMPRTPLATRRRNGGVKHLMAAAPNATVVSQLFATNRPARTTAN